jgi:DNA-binding Lrp family transcriptional regulator
MTASRSDIDLIDRWQRGFPLTERPFAAVGRAAGVDAATVIATLRRLQAAGVLSRIGAVVRPNTLGASTLAAMRVPPERLDAVAAAVSAEPLVTHNYARAHALNLWFVVAGPTPEAVADTLRRIEERTGLACLDLPLLTAYHVDLGFPLSGRMCRRTRREPASPAAYRPERHDRAVLAAMEDGLPLVPCPYSEVGQAIGIDGEEVIGRIAHLLAAGIVARFGCVVRHRALGYRANAMAVWDVPDHLVDATAARFTAHPAVSLCYRRPRRLPHWRFNLFCMVHARTRDDACATIDAINRTADTGGDPQAVLFSTRCFKQRGARFSDGAP